MFFYRKKYLMFKREKIYAYQYFIGDRGHYACYCNQNTKNFKKKNTKNLLFAIFNKYHYFI